MSLTFQRVSRSANPSLVSSSPVRPRRIIAGYFILDYQLDFTTIDASLARVACDPTSHDITSAPVANRSDARHDSVVKRATPGRADPGVVVVRAAWCYSAACAASVAGLACAAARSALRSAKLMLCQTLL